MPLVAYNVNLGTDNLEICKPDRKTRKEYQRRLPLHQGHRRDAGGQKSGQVSMNLTDYTKTAVYRAFEAVKMEAKRYGVPVLESEIVGLLPMQALVDCAEYYLQVAGFDPSQIMENRLLEEE